MPALDTLHCRVRELLDLELPVKDAGMVLAPPALTLSPPAFRIWHPFHDDVEAQLSRFGEFGSVPDIGAKIAENAARIAAVLHVITQGPGGSISAETMEAGAAVAIWHLNEARRIVGATKIPQDVADADLLLQWLLRRAESTIEPRDILRLAPAPLRVKERRDAAINILLAKHWVRFANVGGADRLVLNPKARDRR